MLDSEAFYGTPSANIPDLTGIVIDDGRIRLLNIIGRGAWGVVYRGEETAHSGVYYAVKCIARRSMTYDQQRTIAKEVRLHALCSRSTPHVVRLLDVVVDDDSGMMYIVTEFCEGGDLLERILAKEYLGNDECIRDTFVQILDAVEACHKSHVYHRDLKPENVFIKNRGKKIVVGDFGFATMKRVTADFRLGSEPFMSPEVRGGVHVRLHRFCSAQADIWALGVILMNLLTGCLPWGKASARDPHFVAYVTKDPDYLLHTFPISSAANEILKSIFTLNPRDRIAIPVLRKRILACATFGPGRKPKLTVNTERYISEDFDCYRDDETDSDTLTDESERNINVDLEVATLHAANTRLPSEVDITDAPCEDDIVVAFPNSPENPQAAREDSAPHTDAGDLVAPVHSNVVPPKLVSDVTDEVFSVDSEGGSHRRKTVPITTSDDSDESEGPITPETHAVDTAAVAGTAALENIDDLAELDLGEARTYSVFRAAEAAAAQVSAENKGEKIPVKPVTLDSGRKEVAAFVPPETAKPLRRMNRRAKRTRSQAATNRFKIEIVDEYALGLERVRQQQRPINPY